MSRIAESRGVAVLYVDCIHTASILAESSKKNRLLRRRAGVRTKERTPLPHDIRSLGYPRSRNNGGHGGGPRSAPRSCFIGSTPGSDPCSGAGLRMERDRACVERNRSGRSKVANVAEWKPPAPIRASRRRGTPTGKYQGARAPKHNNLSPGEHPFGEASILRAYLGAVKNKHSVLFPQNAHQNRRLEKNVFLPRFSLTARGQHNIL